MRKLLALLSTVALGLEGTGLRAAGTMESGAEELLFAEIPVVVEVASLFKESNLQTASTVEMFTEKDWSTRSDRNFYDVIAHMPSTLVLDDFRGKQLYTRGFAPAPAVRGYAMLLDGIPLSGYWGQTALYTMQDFDLNLLDRVEMIRGPGSTIYGSDAFLGVISLKTPKDDRDFASVKAGYGSNYYTLGSALFNKTAGRVRFTGGGGYRSLRDQNLTTVSSTGVSTRLSRKVREQYASRTAFLKVESANEGPVTTGAAFYHTRYMNDCSARWATTAAVNQNPPCQDNNTDLDAGKVTVEVKMPATMSLELMEYGMTSRMEMIGDGNYVGITTLPAGQRRPVFLVRDQRVGTKVFLKQEEGPFDTQWVLGAEHARFEIPNVRMYRFSEVTGRLANVLSGYVSAAGTNLPNSGFIRYSRDVKSVFINGKTTVTEDFFNVTWGARYDTYSDYKVGAQVSPRLGLIFNPTRQTAVKLLYGHAFRAPASVEQHGYGESPSIVRGNTRITPENIDTYEFVLMRETPAWKTELVAFHSYWKDGISAFGAGSYANIGRRVANGLEFKNDSHFGDLGVNFNASWLRAWNPTHTVGVLAPFNYNYFPEWMLNAGASYDFPEKQFKVTLVNGAYWHFIRSGNTADIAGVNPKPYWRTDLNLIKGAGERMNVSLDVRNILNRRNERREPSTYSMEDDPGTSAWLTMNWFVGTRGVLWNQ